MCETSTALEQPTHNHCAVHSEKCATGDGDHSIRRSFDGVAGQYVDNRETLASQDEAETQWAEPESLSHDLLEGGPHRSCTHGTNWKQKMKKTWRSPPVTDCREGIAYRKKKRIGQGMSHGMLGGTRHFSAALTRHHFHADHTTSEIN